MVQPSTIINNYQQFLAQSDIPYFMGVLSEKTKPRSMQKQKIKKKTKTSMALDSALYTAADTKRPSDIESRRLLTEILSSIRKRGNETISFSINPDEIIRGGRFNICRDQLSFCNRLQSIQNRNSSNGIF